jgi:glycosyltransferase involved in cell wall biosynthesis
MLRHHSTTEALPPEVASSEDYTSVMRQPRQATEIRSAQALESQAWEHLLRYPQTPSPALLALYNDHPAAAAAAAYRLPHVSVVIPALNEAKNLQYVLPRIPSWVHEVLLVDGHSTDDTVDVARALRPDIRIVQQQGRGKGVALRTGFSAATGEIIVMLDADGSTDPAEIPAFVGALLAGADFVKGSRFLQGGGTSDMSFHRRFGNWCFVVASRVLFGGQYSDLCYGYNAFYTRVLSQLELDGDGFEIETMMNVRALRAGFKVSEVPSFESDRIYGESNLKAIPDGWRVLKTMIKEWRKPRPPRKLQQPELAAAQPLMTEQ